MNFEKIENGYDCIDVRGRSERRCYKFFIKGSLEEHGLTEIMETQEVIDALGDSEYLYDLANDLEFIKIQRTSFTAYIKDLTCNEVAYYGDVTKERVRDISSKISGQAMLSTTMIMKNETLVIDPKIKVSKCAISNLLFGRNQDGSDTVFACKGDPLVG